MINLAGYQQADEVIRTELKTAGIRIARGQRSSGEVPYTLTGRLGEWTFARAWYYWIASAPQGKGLPLEIAQQLYKRPLPGDGKPKPKTYAEVVLQEKPQEDTYGQIIRAGGDCACRPPKVWAAHFDEEGHELVIDPSGKIEKEYREVVASLPKGSGNGNLRFVRSLDELVVHTLVNHYDIDTQLGLNEFARVVKSL